MRGGETWAMVGVVCLIMAAGGMMVQIGAGGLLFTVTAAGYLLACFRLWRLRSGSDEGKTG